MCISRRHSESSRHTILKPELRQRQTMLPRFYLHINSVDRRDHPRAFTSMMIMLLRNRLRLRPLFAQTITTQGFQSQPARPFTNTRAYPANSLDAPDYLDAGERKVFGLLKDGLDPVKLEVSVTQLCACIGRLLLIETRCKTSVVAVARHTLSTLYRQSSPTSLFCSSIDWSRQCLEKSSRDGMGYS